MVPTFQRGYTMKLLAWYAIVLNVLVIVAFVLSLTGVIDKPTSSNTEQIAWAILSVPVVILGWLVVRRDHD